MKSTIKYIARRVSNDEIVEGPYFIATPFEEGHHSPMGTKFYIGDNKGELTEVNPTTVYITVTSRVWL